MRVGKNVCYKERVSPQVLNAFAFIPSLIFLLFYAKQWDADLNELTISLIILQPLIFLLVTFVSKFIGEKNRTKTIKTNKIDEIRSSNVLIMTFVEIIALLLLLKYAISFVGSFSGIRDLLMSYRHKSDYVQQADLPIIASTFRLVAVYSGYIWAYLLCINIIEKKRKNNKLYILNFFLSIVVSLCSGARGTAVMLLIAFLIQYLLLASRKIKLERKKSTFYYKHRKTGLILFALLIISATQFDKFANLLGRDTSDFTGIYYLAIYLSAPIKNLDIFLLSGCAGFAESIWDTHTLSQLVGYIGPKYFNENPANFIYPFQTVNGYYLGNVATAYADLYYDNGMISFVLFSIIMAILSIYVYRKSMQPYDNYVKSINIFVVVYSLMAFGLLFNFFANEFYNSIVNIDFIRGVFAMVLVKWFLENCRIKFR